MLMPSTPRGQSGRISSRIQRSPVLSRLAGMTAGTRVTNIRVGSRAGAAEGTAGAAVKAPSRQIAGAAGRAAVNGTKPRPAVQRPAQRPVMRYAPRPSVRLPANNTKGEYINQRKPSVEEAVKYARQVSRKSVPLKVDYGNGVDPPHAPKEYSEMPGRMAARRAKVEAERGGAPVPYPPPSPLGKAKAPQRPRVRPAGLAGAVGQRAGTALPQAAGVPRAPGLRGAARRPTQPIIRGAAAAKPVAAAAEQAEE